MSSLGVSKFRGTFLQSLTLFLLYSPSLWATLTDSYATLASSVGDVTKRYGVLGPSTGGKESTSISCGPEHHCNFPYDIWRHFTGPDQDHLTHQSTFLNGIPMAEKDLPNSLTHIFSLGADVMCHSHGMKLNRKLFDKIKKPDLKHIPKPSNTTSSLKKDSNGKHFDIWINNPSVYQFTGTIPCEPIHPPEQKSISDRLRKFINGIASGIRGTSGGQGSSGAQSAK